VDRDPVRSTSARNALSGDTNIRGIDGHPPLIVTEDEAAEQPGRDRHRVPLTGKGMN
jgi:hypothetical protein